jgi:hypothetical protein
MISPLEETLTLMFGAVILLVESAEDAAHGSESISKRSVREHASERTCVIDLLPRMTFDLEYHVIWTTTRNEWRLIRQVLC